MCGCALWTFAETAIARLIAGTLPDNLGSQRVLAKAGFRQEGYLRSRLPGVQGRVDDVQFVLLAEDMLAPGARARGLTPVSTAQPDTGKVPPGQAMDSRLRIP